MWTHPKGPLKGKSKINTSNLYNKVNIFSHQLKLYSIALKIFVMLHLSRVNLYKFYI